MTQRRDLLFPSDYANTCVQNIMTDLCLGIPMDYSNRERQRPSVDSKLNEHLHERNGLGQTLAYVLLRFTEKSLYRKYLLDFIPIDILMLQNTNCGSTALMGFLWGEYENPRFEYLADGKPEELTPTADVLNILVRKSITQSNMTNKNLRGETELKYFLAIASRSRKDTKAVNEILAILK
jgi:hypothetical protein